VALGLGFTSRLGFQLWFVVPASALLFGAPLCGALAYGTYAAIRSGAGGAQAVLARRQVELPDLLRLRMRATATTSAILLVVAAAATGLLV
jgi:hypothetical protein